MSVEERIGRLRQAGVSAEKLSFLEAAQKASFSTLGLKHIGEGAFSSVYLIPDNGSSPTVIKVFKENCSRGGTLSPLQGTVRLYALAAACEMQCRNIRDAFQKGLFPVDALEILNSDTWRQDGFISQPFVDEMFEPTWDAFVAKINAQGKAAKITDEDEHLLNTIQTVFKKSIELGLCIDFKPDNIGYTNGGNRVKRMVIIDTFGLSGTENDDVRTIARTLVREFAKGSRIIQDYLNQVVDSSSEIDDAENGSF
ncbi:MAG TPA: hypothetical protein VIJ46_02750 [Rhabdochlamydiaceae bacterium]